MTAERSVFSTSVLESLPIERPHWRSSAVLLVVPRLGDMFASTCCLCFGLLPTFVDDFDVIIENCCNDGHHIGFHDPGSDIFRSTYSNIYDALEC